MVFLLVLILGYNNSKDASNGVTQTTDENKPKPVTIINENQNSASMSYYNALDGIVFNDGSIKTKKDFYLTFKSNINANATYNEFKNGKYNINFDVVDYELTISNIRALTIHEAYGHGDKGYSDENKNHYKAYEASIDSKYWESTTYRFKYHTVTQMWSYYYRETGAQSLPSKYQNEYSKYSKYKKVRWKN